MGCTCCMSLIMCSACSSSVCVISGESTPGPGAGADTATLPELGSRLGSAAGLLGATLVALLGVEVADLLGVEVTALLGLELVTLGTELAMSEGLGLGGVWLGAGAWCCWWLGAGLGLGVVTPVRFSGAAAFLPAELLTDGEGLEKLLGEGEDTLV